MATVIVNDASCLIDLKKGRLLHAMLGLPFHFVIPFPVRAEELLDFTPQEWQLLDDGGVVTYDLPPEAVADALVLKAEFPALSAKDAMCLVATSLHEDAILLTGDGTLRRIASARSVRVHGVLWLVDRLAEAQAATEELLRSALMTWRKDPAVFLPAAEIDARLRTLSRRR